MYERNVCLEQLGFGVLVSLMFGIRENNLDFLFFLQDYKIFCNKQCFMEMTF